MGPVSAPKAAPPAQIKTNGACLALPTMFRARRSRRVGLETVIGLRFVPFALSSFHRPPQSNDAIGGAGGPNSVYGRHCLCLLIGRPCLHGRRACCKGVVQQRVVGFGRAQSLSLSAMTTTMTKTRDDESKDGAWDDPHCCRILCHVGQRTIEAAEEAEDNAVPPLAAATGEESAIRIPCWHC